MFDHDIEITHRRRPTARSMQRAYADSDVVITATSSDLTETARELLSRMPNDLYAAFRAAMEGQDVRSA